MIIYKYFSNSLAIGNFQDVDTTALQVCHTGRVPAPARVGRDDVASLAVATAMFQTPEDTENDEHCQEPLHYTLACRWVGQALDPYPAQGVKADGAADAETALRRTLQVMKKHQQRKQALEERRLQLQKGTWYDRTKFSISRWLKRDFHDNNNNKNITKRRRTRTQPHGVCVAISIYVMLSLFARTMLHHLIKVVPGGQTWILPALAQVNQWAVVSVSLLLGKFMAILPVLAKRKHYILF